MWVSGFAGLLHGVPMSGTDEKWIYMEFLCFGRLRASLHGIPMWETVICSELHGIPASWQTYEHLYMGFLCGEQKHSFKKSLCLDFAQKRRFYEQALNLERYSARGRSFLENLTPRK